MKKHTRLTTALLAAALLLTSCGGGASAATMHLRKTEGTVGVSDNEGKDIAPKDNLGLYSGYQVGTQAESYAWIDLDKVKLTKLDANSEIEITKEGKKLEIDVKSGSLFFNVTEPLGDDETMDIRTSSMMVGIRGTCGWVTEDTAALLEGTVSVTAGDQEVTVTAGEMAVLKDGTLEVKPLTAASVPAFVREEILEDEKLAETIQDTTRMDMTETDRLMEYVTDQYTQHTAQDLVYSEYIDFEQDGDPELLLVWSDAAMDVYGMRSGAPCHFLSQHLLEEIHKYSLVESNGKLFVCGYHESRDTHAQIVTYSGSLAERDGGEDDWGVVDFWTIDEQGVGRVIIPTEGRFIRLNGSSDVDISKSPEDIQAKYTHVRDLFTIGQ